MNEKILHVVGFHHDAKVIEGTVNNKMVTAKIGFFMGIDYLINQQYPSVRYTKPNTRRPCDPYTGFPI